LIDCLKLFRGQDYEINDKIIIHQPTLNDICNYGEVNYWNLINKLVATPFDYKVELDDVGVDYEKVSGLSLFFLLCHEIPVEYTFIFFGDIDFTTFKDYTNTQNNELVYYSEIFDIVIDSNIHRLISDYIRTIHNFPKKIDVAGNEHTKRYLIETERRKNQRHKNKKFESILIPQISALVNSEGFKYNHDTVWDLNIYAFNDSIKRIQKIKDVDNLYKGIYSGCVDTKSITQEQLNWLGSLDK